MFGGGFDPMEQHRRAMEEHNRLIQQQHPNVWAHMHGQPPPQQFGFPGMPPNQNLNPAQQLMLQQQQQVNMTPAQLLMYQEQQRMLQQQQIHQQQQQANLSPAQLLMYQEQQRMLQQQQIHQQQQQQLLQQGGGAHFSSSSSSSFNDGKNPVYYSQSTVSKAAPDGTAQTLSIEHNSATGETKKVVKRAIGDKAVEDVEISDGNTATRQRKIQNMDPHDHYGFEESWDAKAARLNSGGSAAAVSASAGPHGMLMSGVAAPQVHIEEENTSGPGSSSGSISIQASNVDEPDD